MCAFTRSGAVPKVGGISDCIERCDPSAAARADVMQSATALEPFRESSTTVAIVAVCESTASTAVR